MRFTTERKTLAQHLARLAPFAGRRPGTDLVRVEVADGRLAVSATDHLAWASISSPVESGEAASSVVPLERLRSVLAAIDSELVEVGVDATAVVVADDAGRARLLADQRPFPPLPKVADAGDVLAMPTADLAERLGSVSVAMAKEAARYAINGVQVEQGVAVATDGRMLAMRNGLPKHDAVLLPDRLVRSVCDFAKAFPEGEATLSAGKAAVTVAGTCGEVRWLVGSTRLEGLFPPWRGVVPRDEPKATLVVEVERFAAALRQAATLTDDDSRGVRATLDAGSLVMVARSQVGESEVRLAAEGRGAAQVGMNPVQAGALLSGCPSEAVLLEVTEPSKPIRFVAQGIEWRAVLMPLSLA